MEDKQKPIGPIPVAYTGPEPPEPEPEPEVPFTFDPKDPDHQQLAKLIGMRRIRAIERSERLPMDLQRGPFSRVKAKTATQPKSCYETREARAARKYATPLPYLRLDDGPCKTFLELAKSPTEFDGLKLLFPFIREMSLLRFERTVEKIGVWMQLAFLAGHDLGRAHPELLDDLLPGQELREAQRRLQVLGRCSGEEHMGFEGLSRACAVIAKTEAANTTQDQLVPLIVSIVIRTLRVGYVAATAALYNPVQCELILDIPERVGDGIKDIVSKLLVGAPLEAVGMPVHVLMEHPLLRLAREYYRGQPKQRDMVLDFLRHRLRRLGVKSENECPTTEADLLDWIAEGLEYGRCIKAERPELVEQIFTECGQSRLGDAIEVVQSAVAEAGGTDPVRLLGPLKSWQRGVYGWSEPKYYGEELARAVYFSDFAIWISFALSGT